MKKATNTLNSSAGASKRSAEKEVTYADSSDGPQPDPKRRERRNSITSTGFPSSSAQPASSSRSVSYGGQDSHDGPQRRERRNSVTSIGIPPSSALSSSLGRTTSSSMSLSRGKKDSHKKRHRHEHSDFSADDDHRNSTGERRSSFDNGSNGIFNKTELRSVYGLARRHYAAAKLRNAASGMKSSRLRMAFEAIIAGLRTNFRMRNILQAWLEEKRERKQRRESEELMRRFEIKEEAVQEERSSSKTDNEFALLRSLLTQFDVTDDPTDQGCGDIMAYLASLGEANQATAQVLQLANSLKEAQLCFADLRRNLADKLAGLESINSSIDNSVQKADNTVALVEQQVAALQERLLEARRQRETLERERERTRTWSNLSETEEASASSAATPGPSTSPPGAQEEEEPSSPGSPSSPVLAWKASSSSAQRSSTLDSLGLLHHRRRPQELDPLDVGEEDPWLKEQLDANFIKRTERHLCLTPMVLLKKATEELQKLSESCGGPELPFSSRIDLAVDQTDRLGPLPRASPVAEDSELGDECAELADDDDGGGILVRKARSLQADFLSSLQDDGGTAGHCNTLDFFGSRPSTLDFPDPPSRRRPLLIDTVRSSIVKVRSLKAMRSPCATLNYLSEDSGDPERAWKLLTPQASLPESSRVGSVEPIELKQEALERWRSSETPLEPQDSPVPCSSRPATPSSQSQRDETGSRDGWPVPGTARNLPGRRLSVITGAMHRLPQLPPTPELCWELLNPGSVEAVVEERRRLARGDRPLSVIVPRPHLPESPLEEQPRHQRPCRPFDGSPLLPSGGARRPHSVTPPAAPKSARSCSREEAAPESAKVPCSKPAAAWKGRRFVFIQEAPRAHLRQHAYVARHSQSIRCAA